MFDRKHSQFWTPMKPVALMHLNLNEHLKLLVILSLLFVHALILFVVINIIISNSGTFPFSALTLLFW